MSERHVFQRNAMEPPLCKICRHQPDADIHQMGDIQRAADRPVRQDDKLSEGDQRDAREMIDQLPRHIAVDLVFMGFDRRIATYAASVRLAERDRIREAVEELPHFDEVNYRMLPIRDVLAAIDGLA